MIQLKGIVIMKQKVVLLVKLYTKEGLKELSTIKIGDLVLSYNEKTFGELRFNIYTKDSSGNLTQIDYTTENKADKLAELLSEKASIIEKSKSKKQNNILPQ